jgi:hypothetical protein
MDYLTDSKYGFLNNNDNNSKLSDDTYNQKKEKDFKTKKAYKEYLENIEYKKKRLHIFGYSKCYSTGCTGSTIRHAITGEYYPPEYKVGSKYEYYLFSVRDAVGRNGRTYGLNFFYNSPEECEAHQFLLKPDIKEKWRIRLSKILNDNKNNKNEKNNVNYLYTLSNL